MKVWVVTGFELGWDNVCGIFDVDKVSLEELEGIFPSKGYYIQLKDIQVDLSEWED